MDKEELELVRKELSVRRVLLVTLKERIRHEELLISSLEDRLKSHCQEE